MAEEARIKVWDIAVRVVHWTLLVVFFVAYFSGDEDLLHVYAGYGVLALVMFVMLYAAGARIGHFVVLGIALLPIAWRELQQREYVVRRIMGFTGAAGPEAAPRGQGNAAT